MNIDMGSFALDVGMQTSSLAEAPRPDDCGQAIATLVTRALAANLPEGVALHVVLMPSEAAVGWTVRVYWPFCETLGRRPACEFSDFAVAIERAKDRPFEHVA